ncbi:hypothetical protein MRX96_043399 [Rhipicephalus microplus]
MRSRRREEGGTQERPVPARCPLGRSHDHVSRGTLVTSPVKLRARPACLRDDGGEKRGTPLCLAGKQAFTSECRSCAGRFLAGLSCAVAKRPTGGGVVWITLTSLPTWCACVGLQQVVETNSGGLFSFHVFARSSHLHLIDK